MGFIANTFHLGAASAAPVQTSESPTEDLTFLVEAFIGFDEMIGAKVPEVNELEQQLKAAGFPRIGIVRHGDAELTYGDGQPEREFGVPEWFDAERAKRSPNQLPALVAERDKLMARFQALQAKWNDAAERVGFATEARIRSELNDRREDLWERIEAAPVRTASDAAAKLLFSRQLLLFEGDHDVGEDSAEIVAIDAVIAALRGGVIRSWPVVRDRRLSISMRPLDDAAERARQQESLDSVPDELWDRLARAILAAYPEWSPPVGLRIRLSASES